MSRCEEFSDTSVAALPVRGFLHRPDGPPKGGGGGDALVLTHSAGANAQSSLLIAMADAFCDAGLTVLRCDLPFRQERPHGPPPRGSAERDQKGLQAAVSSIRRQTTGRIFLGGHSYGGRQASMLAASDAGDVERLLLLSYPLHPPRRTEQTRTAHFPRLHVPAMFVHGSRDPFGSIAEMEEALRLIPARTRLIPLEGAEHELMTSRNRERLARETVEAFLTFVSEEDGGAAG